MSQEIVKLNVNNGVSLEHSCHVKEEFQDEYYPDKVCISEIAITDTIKSANMEINEYVRNDKIGNCETFIELIKTDLPSSEVNNTVNNNVKREYGICPADIQIQFCNEFCNHCHEVYQDYCNKCRMLVHILNKRHFYTTHNRIRELPEYILEARGSIGHLGIFSLKVIPENVLFGPFTGLNSTGLPLKIKGGCFVVSDDKLEYLNWMQFINPARNISEQNLFPFQNEDKLYYCSTRRIEEDEELLVYFGEEYDDNILQNMEMNFVPISKKVVENVFACIFCCLGFSSKEYLTEHKAVCHSGSNEMFSVEELAQCPLCKIYLDAKEYHKHHKDYCCETNARYCVPPAPKVCEAEIARRLLLRSKAERRKRGIYKCTQCKFSTMYSAEFRHHTSEHCQVKKCKCGIRHRRYKAKASLKVHVKTKHLGDINYKCRKCEFKTNDKPSLKVHINGKHLKQNNYKCEDCEFKTKYKGNLEAHKRSKHLKQNYYECAECEFKTSYKSSLQVHIKAKHLKENYKCTACEYKTNYKSNLEIHIKTKHLKQKDYKCMECEYKTFYKLCLQVHIKTKHLQENDYKCADCEFKTNYKSNLKKHIKAKHLIQNDYKCMGCDYKTNIKSYLQVHIKTKHLKQNNYKCEECEHKTSYKCSLERHIKAKHIKETYYKCAECEYKTSYRTNLERHLKEKHLTQNGYKNKPHKRKTSETK